MITRARNALPGDRGAVLPMTALMIVVLLICTAFSIDLGRQMMLRRELQADADVIAFDLSRLLDGSFVSDFEAAEVTASSEVYKTLYRSADANDVDPLLIRDPSAAIDRIRWGEYDPSSDTFTPGASTDVPTAVEVSITDNIDYYFATVVGMGSGEATRTAVAADTLRACYTLGSLGAGLSSQQSALLNPLISDALNIGAVDYSGLVNADITLGDLATELGLGSPDELATTTTSVSSFYIAMANVLQNNGDTANATLLQSVAAQSASSGNVDIGDLLAMSTNDTSAFDTAVNVFGLVSGAAFVANGTNALGVPAVNLNLGSLAQGTGSLTVIERPRTACGGINDPNASARTSQINLTQDLAGNVGLGIPGLSVANNLAAVTGTLDLQGASATSDLSRILCANPVGIDVDVVTALLEVRLTLTVTVLGLTIPVTVLTNPPTTSSTAVWRMPPLTAFGETVGTGSGSVGLAGGTVQVGPASGSISALLNIVLAPLGGVNYVLGRVTSQIVNPLINNIDALLVGPLSSFLGLRIAGADVAALSVVCTPPLIRK